VGVGGGGRVAVGVGVGSACGEGLLDDPVGEDGVAGDVVDGDDFGVEDADEDEDDVGAASATGDTTVSVVCT
jgi:hypothetical protein